MRAFEPVSGVRVVADPAALDAARWAAADGSVTVLRIAPDDAFGVGATGVVVDDAHAIVEEETGFVALSLSGDELTRLVLPRIEWHLPDERPALGQGLVAGEPCKLWLASDGSALLLVAAAYADELAERLG